MLSAMFLGISSCARAEIASRARQREMGFTVPPGKIYTTARGQPNPAVGEGIFCLLRCSLAALGWTGQAPSPHLPSPHLPVGLALLGGLPRRLSLRDPEDSGGFDFTFL
jgi:hypothetical protein